MKLAYLAAAAVAVAASHAGGTTTDRSFGIWTNPKGSVHIRAQSCGARMCGVVVWASDKAKGDARKGGTDPLVGSTIFRDFVPEQSGVWRGKVFVPDIGRTFSGTISLIDENTIEGRGCLVGRLGCKSQRWTRVRS